MTETITIENNYGNGDLKDFCSQCAHQCSNGGHCLGGYYKCTKFIKHHKMVRLEKEVWESTLRVSMERAAEIEKLKEQLKLAIKGLQYYANEDIYNECHQIVNGKNEWMSEVMVDCGVKADYALKKIKELGYDKKT